MLVLFVFGNIGLGGRSVVAVSTLVWFLASVNSSMLVYVTLLLATVITHCTRIYSAICIGLFHLDDVVSSAIDLHWSRLGLPPQTDTGRW